MPPESLPQPDLSAPTADAHALPVTALRGVNLTSAQVAALRSFEQRIREVSIEQRAFVSGILSCVPEMVGGTLKGVDYERAALLVEVSLTTA